MSANTPLFFLGATIVGVVGAIGIFIVDHFKQKKQRHAMVRDMNKLNHQISNLQLELKQLQLRQKEKNAQKIRKRNVQERSRISSGTSDKSSNKADEDSSDEYYDFSDEDDNDSTVTVTPLEQALIVIDHKLNSSNIEDIKESWTSLKEFRAEYPDNSEILWRIGKAIKKIADSTTDINVKRTLLDEGLVTCQKSVQLYSNSAEAHKWLAILVGAHGGLQSVKERIGGGFIFKKHLDKALVLNPTDPTLYHLLARFNYELASLTWYERQFATTFFAEPPTGSFLTGLNFAIEAERRFKLDWKENKLVIAQCQIALGNYQEGVDTLLKADVMESDPLTPMVDSEIQTLLKKYNSYR